MFSLITIFRVIFIIISSGYLLTVLFSSASVAEQPKPHLPLDLTRKTWK